MKSAGERLFRLREEGRRLFSLESGIQKSVSVLNLIVLIGVLYLVSPFSKTHAEHDFFRYLILLLMAGFLGINYFQHLTLMRLRKKWMQLEEESIHDGLTRAFNRSYFEEILEDEINRAKRYRFELSLCIIDIDNFKLFNDTLGHAHGDKLLKDFAARVQKAIRSADCLARYGGDEFCVLLPHTGMSQAERFLSRVLTEMQEWLDTNFSAGVTAYRAGEGKIEFLQRADLALYQAKREGKSCIRCMISADDSQEVLQIE